MKRFLNPTTRGLEYGDTIEKIGAFSFLPQRYRAAENRVYDRFARFSLLVAPQRRQTSRNRYAAASHG